MPLVDIECRQCGRVSEVLVRHDEEPVCPACQSSKVVRRLGVPAIAKGKALPISGSACSRDLPPCGPGCCRLP